MKLNWGAKDKLTVALFIILIPIIYWGLNRAGYLPSFKYLFTKKEAIKSDSLPVARDDLLDYNRSLSEILNEPLDTSQTAIKVEKSQYKLTLYYRGTAIKSYPIVLGGNPVEDKLKEGDSKTPEGIFKIRDLYPHASWSKFIWIDYPNEESWRKHLAAKQAGQISSFSRIGGEIGIHGVPNNRNYLIDNNSNWTLGCVSLKNQDVDEIYTAVRVGTTVEITP
ncbi:MAG: L,D-transpeptidase [Cyanobacteria bacterium J06621_8]